MSKKEILPGIYWVGAIDWNVRNFHGHTYTTKRGTTYNAYLIVDEKVALVDTVLHSFSDEMIDRIKQVIPPEKIDYIIANHVEKDHSGALPEIIKYCPKAKVVGTAKCKDGLYKNYCGGAPVRWTGQDFRTVKTGDKISLGKRTLSFIEAPMLHWPDSMFTYIPEDALLIPNDAFGQHYASGERFDDEVDECGLMDEAAKYYANILWPLSSIVLKKIEDVQKINLPIKIIAPSHGIIWRRDPMKIVNAYAGWAKNETKPKAVIVYETMWGATEKMARKISEGMTDAGVSVKLYDVSQSDRTEIIGEMLDSRGFVLGSSTHGNGMLPSIYGFLEFLKGLKPKNRTGFAFGSYGWAGGAVRNIENILREAGVEIGGTGLSVRYAPDENEIKGCYEAGRTFAEKCKHI
ncbi:MAG: flavodoxin domain-containing protein [Elusimicrobia bacterium]|nr:flavodoxin domain-containing protein [Elusimicrobiota bacterium]